MLSPLAFVELSKNVIRYLKYLFAKKIFKSFKIEINGNTCNNWFYKQGLCLKINPNIKSRYCEMLKEAIHNLPEIKSIDIHSFKSGKNGKDNIEYFSLFDWTKVKILNFADCLNTHYAFIGILDYIPKISSFVKLYVDENRFINFRKIFSFVFNYAKLLETIKIINFSDMNYINKDNEYKVDTDYFVPFNNLKSL